MVRWVGALPNIGYNSNSTLGLVELTWSGDGVEMELGVELELDNTNLRENVFYFIPRYSKAG